MTKKDIGAGDIVLLKDGRRCIVMPYVDDPNRGLVLYGRPSDNYNAITLINMLDDYNDDLTPLDGDNGYTIMAVRTNTIASTDCLFRMLTDYSIDKYLYYWDWKREEVKEVTMSEVEEKFGCKVKIVKEEMNERSIN